MSELKKGLVLSCYRHFIRRRRHLVGASVSRIVYGVWLLCYYLQSLSIRHFIWGEAGPLNHNLFQRYLAISREYTLFNYSASPLWLDFLLAAAIIFAALLTVGLFTETSLLVSVVLLWSFNARNPYILDGGDNVGRIILIFFLFMNCSAYFSLDARLGRKVPTTAIRTLLHNVAFYTITIQYCLLYFSSSLGKVTGPLWQNGTAIYYVLKSSQFANPRLAPLLSRNYFLITLTSYATIGLQLSFAFLVWTRYFRVPVILGLILMHLSIGVIMGLVHFSTSAIAGLLLLIPDSSYQKFGRMLRALYTASYRTLPVSLPPLMRAFAAHPRSCAVSPGAPERARFASGGHRTK